MALAQVRAQIGSEWVTLAYNDATERYEGKAVFIPPGFGIDPAPWIADGYTIIPLGASIHQPGGYYNVKVEATNDSGDTAAVSGDQLAPLRLTVKDITAPTLSLVSPVPGYLNTATPIFVFDAVDEAGGSGINPDSFSLDGATAQAITGGYRFTWSPPGGWADGPHTVTASVADYDGNTASASGAYTVDTIPPELYITTPYMRHVVDDMTVTVTGSVSDLVSGVLSVTVGGQDVPVVSGQFKKQIDLAVGENTISIWVTDGAGNHTTGSVYMIRLITDRTRADVAVLENLYAKLQNGTLWTESELEWFNTALAKGAYNAEDLNRVGVAVQWLAGELTRRGYIANVQAKIDWTGTDAPTQPQMSTYLQNVETVRSAQNLYVPEIPYTMRKSTVEDWNKIEKALVETDKYFPNYFAWTAGEITAGEG